MNCSLPRFSFNTFVLATLLFCASDSLVLAQTPIPTPSPEIEQCLDLVGSLKTAIAECDDINSNWACYANIEADVVPVEYRFHGLRDRRPLTVLEELNTDAKGVVLMNLQIEGKTNPIKTMVFGDGRLDAEEPGQYSFFMRIDDPTELCSLTPPGMVIHTETGQSGVITINNVTIELASTAYITIEADGLMTVVNLGGQVTVVINGVRRPLLVGEQVRVFFVNGAPQFAGPPTPSPFFNSIVLTFLASGDGLARIRNSNETTAACVQEIKFGETISSQNMAAGHECLFHFCAAAGDRISINMDATSPGLDPWVDLRGPDGLLIAFNNDVEMAKQDSLLCNVGLGATSCDYTVVARSNRNESFGSFNLSLGKQTACVQPEPRCTVMFHRGLNLREGPGVQFAPIDTLAQGTAVEPLLRSEDSSWVFVSAPERAIEGWVRNSPELFECEFSEPRVSIVETLPTEPRAPAATVMAASCDGLIAPPHCPDFGKLLPNGDRIRWRAPEEQKQKEEVCEKCSPFGAP